ncbi:hypothetical protein AALT52_01355 [Ligilactobacillus faecis]|uniref:Uncharacterized protein n=1 Tax=Ligilactobacillus faecis TaxID=762833 RepID=A0ABV4DQ62_9LACO
MFDETKTPAFKNALVKSICAVKGFKAQLSDNSKGATITIIVEKSGKGYVMSTENDSRNNYLDSFFRRFGQSKSPLKRLVWLLATDEKIVPYMGLSAIEVLYSLYDTTAYKVYKNSDIPRITIYKASDKDVYRMSIRVLEGIAISLNESPGKILDQLLDIQKAFDRK